MMRAEFPSSRVLVVLLAALAVVAAPAGALADRDAHGSEPKPAKSDKPWKRSDRAEQRGDDAIVPLATRHWRRGQVLPPAYRRGVVRDHYRYGLYRPPRGHAWVRVGEDAYLTGPRGQIVAVLRDNY